MGYLVSWSGGKDSCLAFYEAISQGFDVTHLINFIITGKNRISFHSKVSILIQLQAKAIGLPLLQREATWDEYEQQFKNSVKSLIPSGVDGIIFGDIYLREHRNWVERVCRELGIDATEPLWNKDTEKIFTEFIDAGFHAIIVSANSKLFNKEWIGSKLDEDFLRYLKRNNIDPCGENGEYHTFVFDGPLFNKEIKIIKSRLINRNGYWILDIIDASS